MKSELSGVLNWALQGCKAWQREGLTTPQAVIAATEEYRSEQDPLENFISEKCFRESGCKVTNSDLFQAYERWAREDDSRCSPTKLSQRLKQKGWLQRRETGGVRWWHSIGLLTSDSPTSEPNPWAYATNHERF